MKTPEQLSAELYDVSVPDWDGEIDLYRDLAREAKARRESVLEVACGTGRVTLRLAQAGVDIVGTDLDEEMLKIARQKVRMYLTSAGCEAICGPSISVRPLV